MAERLIDNFLPSNAWQDLVEEILGYDPFRCKKCKKGKMLMHEKIEANPRAA